MSSISAAAGTRASPPAQASADAAETHALMRAAGIDDAFVLSRGEAGRWDNHGGGGRGSAWTGGLEVDAETTPLLRQSLAQPGDVVRLAGSHERLRHVVGPYFATAAAVVALTPDLVVVFGCRGRPPTVGLGRRNPARTALGEPPGDPLATTSDAALRAIATALASVTPEVPAANALAHELEVLHAVQAVTRSLDLAFLPALQHLATVTARDLGASYVIAVTAGGEYAQAGRGWAADPAIVPDGAAAVAALFHRRSRTVCVQDAEQAPLPAPFATANGVRSYLAVPLAQPVGGILLALHAEPAVRGFTALNRRVAEQLVEAASVLLQVADLRRELQDKVEQSAHEARHDALTGVANRLAWDEAMNAAQRSVDLGGTVSLVIADLNGLKAVNDTHGHAAGDHLISTLANTLRGAVRGNDLVARLGGDEFAVLLPDLNGPDAGRALDRLRNALGDVRTADGLPVRAALGVGTCEPSGSVTAAWRDADQAMYAEKRKQHARQRARRAAMALNEPA
jgi:diguanylate cyclase (GGDEF)-like protein